MPSFESSENEESTADTDLAFHASGFVVQCDGAWTEAILAQLRSFLKARRLTPSEPELSEALAKAKERYLATDRHLYVCVDRPCSGGARGAPSGHRLAMVPAGALPISRTGCQGICKKAPVAALRVGGRSQLFAQVVTPDDWLAVVRFAESAVRAGSLLVTAGDAARFFHDPLHDHGGPGKQLGPLSFLLGRFRGEGRYLSSSYTFRKEVLGTYEAGGQFIALRMEASYPTPDGREDVHKALVIVGAEASSGALTGRAYTDGGVVHEYRVERGERALQFADAPPDHSDDWAKARKIIEPTRYGFEERLEVDTGDGFRPYYAISMQRLEAL